MDLTSSACRDGIDTGWRERNQQRPLNFSSYRYNGSERLSYRMGYLYGYCGRERPSLRYELQDVAVGNADLVDGFIQGFLTRYRQAGLDWSCNRNSRESQRQYQYGFLLGYYQGESSREIWQLYDEASRWSPIFQDGYLNGLGDFLRGSIFDPSSNLNSRGYLRQYTLGYFLAFFNRDPVLEGQIRDLTGNLGCGQNTGNPPEAPDRNLLPELPDLSGHSAPAFQGALPPVDEETLDGFIVGYCDRYRNKACDFSANYPSRESLAQYKGGYLMGYYRTERYLEMRCLQDVLSRGSLDFRVGFLAGVQDTIVNRRYDHTVIRNTREQRFDFAFGYLAGYHFSGWQPWIVMITELREHKTVRYQDGFLDGYKTARMNFSFDDSYSYFGTDDPEDRRQYRDGFLDGYKTARGIPQVGRDHPERPNRPSPSPAQPPSPSQPQPHPQPHP